MNVKIRRFIDTLLCKIHEILMLSYDASKIKYYIERGETEKHITLYYNEPD